MDGRSPGRLEIRLARVLNRRKPSARLARDEVVDPGRRARPSSPRARPRRGGRCAPARERNDRRRHRAAASQPGPSASQSAVMSSSIAKASRVPCRNSMGIRTSNRCAPRSRDGLPAGWRGKPRNASPRTPGSGSSDCACDVIRPPNDLPPAISGIPGRRRPASPTAARTVACATFGVSGRLPPCSI